MYILDERKYIENILASAGKPDDLSMHYFIMLIAKYYYADTLDAGRLSDIVKETLHAFHPDHYQEYQYHNKILLTCEGLYDGSIDRRLKEKPYIPIYENELRMILALPNDRQKKLMFTFTAVARYMDCGGWINTKSSKGVAEVFRLANVTLSADARSRLLHELYTKGAISFGKRIDSLNIKVSLDDSGGIAYKIETFENIGNQYIGNFKQGYKQCKNCGKKIKVTGTNHQYCKQCAKEKQLARQRTSMKKLRETEKREVS